MTRSDGVIYLLRQFIRLTEHKRSCQISTVASNIDPAVKLNQIPHFCRCRICDYFGEKLSPTEIRLKREKFVSGNDITAALNAAVNSAAVHPTRILAALAIPYSVISALFVGVQFPTGF